MKTLILFLISFSALASNWAPISKIQSQSLEAYQLKSDCESRSQEQCIDIGDEPEALKQGFVSLENDWGPEQEVEACDGQMLCQSALEAKSCKGGLQKFIDQAFTKVYCVQLIGKKLVKDAAGFASYKAEQAQSAALAFALSQAKKIRECGQGVMDLLLVRNAQKNPPLSTTQVKQVVGVYAPIKGLLETGSLKSAKEEVEKVEPDEVLITKDDKEAIIGAIDLCLGGH